MPYGEVDLVVPRDKDRPTIDKIFQCFRKDKILNVKAFLKGKEAYHWRPQGMNTYNLRIISIEALPNPDKSFKWRDSYIAKAILIGMNGKENQHPNDISWTHSGPKYEVRLFFNNHHGMSFQYGEYLTL